MTSVSSQRHAGRLRRHRRVRKKITGTAERPRLAVYRSNKHITVQLINDLDGHTVVSASTVVPDHRQLGSGSNVDAAKRIGTHVSQRAKAAGVTKVVYDRGGFLYHGRVAAAADAAREAGLEF
ncbi:MAG: 50S ribosomal protein L18 [Actinomycetes bacterium]